MKKQNEAREKGERKTHRCENGGKVKGGNEKEKRFEEKDDDNCNDDMMITMRITG